MVDVKIKIDTSKIVEKAQYKRRIQLYMSKTFDKETLPSGTTANTEFGQALNVEMPEDLKTKNVKIYLEPIVISRNLTYEIFVSRPWQSTPTTGEVLVSGSTDNTATYRVPHKWIDITKMVMESNFIDIKIRGYNTDSTAESILAKGTKFNIWIDYGEY